MMQMTLAQVGPVIDLGAVPWVPLGIAAGIFWAILEARLIRAGFVRQKDLDGLGRRLDEKFATAVKGQEAIESMFIMVRDDLDATRDRATRLEGQHEALATRIMDRLAPLADMSTKLDKALLALERHETEIENLKRGRNSG